MFLVELAMIPALAFGAASAVLGDSGDFLPCARNPRLNRRY